MTAQDEPTIELPGDLLPLLAYFASVNKHSESAFSTKHPMPYFVYADDKDWAKTPSYTTTQIISPTILRGLAPATSKLALERTVALLKKSTRNPFTSQLYIGRASNNDIVILDKSVSKTHAFFQMGETDWMLTDVQSVNGTFVNGVRLSDKQSMTVPDGARIQLGTVVGNLYTPASFHRYVKALLETK